MIEVNQILKTVVVPRVSTKLLSQLQLVDPLITGVYFEYGHYTDIQQRLDTYAKDNKLVYPLICLFEDYQTDMGKEGTDGTSSLKILILYISQNTVTREWREENVFQKVLFLVESEFLRQLKLCGYFQIYDESKVIGKRIKRPHWGDPALYKNDGYLFNRVLDGIEYQNVQLLTYKKSC